MSRSLVLGLVCGWVLVGCVGDSPGTPPTTDAGVIADAGNDVTPDAEAKPRVVGIYGGGSLPLSGLLKSDSRSCAIVAPRGQVYCWGGNSHGELGTGDAIDATVPKKINVDADGKPFEDVVELALGAWHSCARKANGHVWCWGQAQTGAIGDGVVQSSPTPLPDQRVPREIGDGTLVASSIAVGSGHTCIVGATSHQVTCFGNNDERKLGAVGGTPCYWVLNPSNGTSVCMGTYQKVVSPDVANVTQVVAGLSATCALTAAQTVYCWGEPSYSGGTVTGYRETPYAVPAAVNGLTPIGSIASLALSIGTLCALGTDGIARCTYGLKGEGGSVTNKGILAPIDEPIKFVSIARGALFTCGIPTGGVGNVRCWGENDAGQLGYGVVDNVPHPTNPGYVGTDPNKRIGGITQLGLGFRHGCALKVDGTVYCWGSNDQGQLGNGTTVDSSVAIEVSVLP
ncbi:hypothetical protein BH09MYX1_BH09MYX1_35970 [soil metagenome]